jgi:hypothetical protein
MANNKQVAADYIELLKPHRPTLSLLVKCIRFLPAVLFRVGKNIRNLITIRSINSE